MTGSPRLLFIFGIARGGTNLVARMLRQHSLVSIGLDATLPVLNAWRSEILHRTSYAGLPAGSVPAHPDYYFSAQAHESLSSVMGWQEDVAFNRSLQAEVMSASESRARIENLIPHGAFRHLNAASAGRAVESIIRMAALDAGEPKWLGTKEVWAVDMIPSLAATFRDARFIVINRDPRAIVSSLIGLSDDDPTQWAHVPSYLRHWRKQVAILHELSGKPGDLSERLMVVRFEDLVNRPNAMAREMVAHLEIRWEESVLRPDGDRQWLGNSSTGPLDLPIDPFRAVDWQSALDPRSCGFVEALARPEMRLAGYHAAEQDREAIDSLVALELRRYDSKPGRWRSDSGDMAHETINEIERIDALESRDTEILTRRVAELFLFPSVLSDAISAIGTE